MGKLQFTKTDTVRWKERYGNGSDGDATPSGTFGNANTTFSGTEDATTGTVGSNSGFAIGDLVLIHQSRNGGDGAGNWMLNKIENIASTTFTFKYPLAKDFGTTAQIVKINQNKNITVSGTLSAADWAGSVGGIVVLMAKKKILVSGTISVDGAGYRGGSGNNNSGVQGTQGEGHTGTGSQSASANGSGGGGGRANDTTPSGGGNSTTGGGSNGGSDGGSQADLTIMLFGGGGGGYGRDNEDSTGSDGAGIVILIAPIIEITGDISLDTGTTNLADSGGSTSGSAGTGAGGSCLLKGEKLILGTNKITALAANSGGGSRAGGKGSDGRVRAEYGISITGTTNPTMSSARDTNLINKRGGAALLTLL